jgi:hypothetical protein
VYVDRTTNASADAANVFVYNCVFVANGGSGVFLQCYVWNYGNAFGYPNLTAYNSVMIRNSRYGVEAGSTGGPTLGTIRLDCNNYNNNAMGKYSDLFGPGKPVSPGANSIDVSPEFVGGSGDVCGQDLRLAPTSPCRDKGQPGTAWLDPDGTRNDLGAYGGPGAQRFYTFPNDGPFIREVTIPQGMVPYGTTFTIRARAAVR